MNRTRQSVCLSFGIICVTATCVMLRNTPTFVSETCVCFSLPDETGGHLRGSVISGSMFARDSARSIRLACKPPLRRLACGGSQTQNLLMVRAAEDSDLPRSMTFLACTAGTGRRFGCCTGLWHESNAGISRVRQSLRARGLRHSRPSLEPSSTWSIHAARCRTGSVLYSEGLFGCDTAGLLPCDPSLCAHPSNRPLRANGTFNRHSLSPAIAYRLSLHGAFNCGRRLLRIVQVGQIWISYGTSRSRPLSHAADIWFKPLLPQTYAHAPGPRQEWSPSSVVSLCGRWSALRPSGCMGCSRHLLAEVSLRSSNPTSM